MSSLVKTKRPRGKTWAYEECTRGCFLRLQCIQHPRVYSSYDQVLPPCRRVFMIQKNYLGLISDSLIGELLKIEHCQNWEG